MHRRRCLLAAAGAFAGVAGLRRDVFGALFQVFNWVKLSSGQSYADLTTAAAGLRTPFDHYWSLSVEEQFYWVWPLVFSGWCASARRRPRWSLLRRRRAVRRERVAAPAIARLWGPDAAYWATPARASEILVGALLAAGGDLRPRRDRGRPASWWVGGAVPGGARRRRA